MPFDPANFGTNIVGAVQKQSAFDTNLTAFTAADAKLIEFRPPFTLQPVREFYPANRMKGNPSPDPMVEGMQMGSGLIHFYADPRTTPFWLAELLMADPAETISQNLDDITGTRSSPFGDSTTPDPLRAAGAYTSGTMLAALDEANQPFKRIETHATFAAGTSLTDIKYPTGLRATQLVFTFGSASTGSRKIEIEGTDLNDTPINETLNRTDITAAITDGDAADVMTTKRWYKTITKITVTDSASATNDDLTITAKLGTYYHRLKFTKEVNEGLTIEVHEGNSNLPMTYRGGFVTRGILNLEKVVRFIAMIFASRAEPRRSISGSTTGTSLSTFTRQKPQFIADWGMGFEILDSPGLPTDLIGQHRIANSQFAIDNLIAPPATKFAEDFNYPKCVRKANRDLMFSTSVDHHASLNFDQFVGQGNFKSVISGITRPFAGPYMAIRFIADNSQLVSFPTREVNELEEVIQNLTVRLNIGESIDGNDEAFLEIYNDQDTP